MEFTQLLESLRAGGQPAVRAMQGFAAKHRSDFSFFNVLRESLKKDLVHELIELLSASAPVHDIAAPAPSDPTCASAALCCLRILSRERMGVSVLFEPPFLRLLFALLHTEHEEVRVEAAKLGINCTLDNPAAHAALIAIKPRAGLLSLLGKCPNPLPGAAEFWILALKLYYLVALSAQEPPSPSDVHVFLSLLSSHAKQQSCPPEFTAELLKILFAATRSLWREAEANEAQMSVQQAMPCLDALIFSLPGESELLTYAVQLLSNTPPRLTPLLLQRQADEACAAHPPPKATAIVERHWDPDRPGEQNVRVVSGLASVGAAAAAAAWGPESAQDIEEAREMTEESAKSAAGQREAQGKRHGDLQHGLGAGKEACKQRAEAEEEEPGERDEPPSRGDGDEGKRRKGPGGGDEGRPLDGAALRLLDKLLAYVDAKIELDEREATLLPAVLFLTGLADYDRDVRKHLKHVLLPRRTDFSRRPEEGDGPGARLIGCMVSVEANTAHVVAQFLYVLCNRNAARLVRRTGFGNAAGLLMSLGITQPPAATADSDTESDSECMRNVDPITGRAWDAAPPPLSPARPPAAAHMDPPSEEDKERMAAELMHLIHRLNATGVMQMQVPGPVGGGGEKESGEDDEEG